MASGVARVGWEGGEGKGAGREGLRTAADWARKRLPGALAVAAAQAGSSGGWGGKQAGHRCKQR